MKITKLLLPESQPAHALLVRAKKVVLTYAQRVKTPAEFSVDGVTYENALGDVPPLEVGDVLVDEKGSFLVVEAAPDEIMKVSGDHELMQEAVYAFTVRGYKFTYALRPPKTVLPSWLTTPSAACSKTWA